MLLETAFATPLAACGTLIAVLVGVVIFNVLYQLYGSKDPSRPPVVFHFVPIIGCAVSYGTDPYKFLFDCRDQYGPVFTYPLLGRWVTAALGPQGNNFVLNGKLAHVNAEAAYTNLTTPVFGTEVVYDCPNHMLMEQKKFVKYGLGQDNFKRYVGLIKSEVVDYLTKTLFAKSNGPITVDAFVTSSEITICTASATLQGKEVRAALDKSFAQLYHALDGGFTPLNFVFPNAPIPANWRRDAAQKKMRQFYIDILNKRRQSGEWDEDMLTALTSQEYKSGEMLTDKQIAHIMIALLMAGQHTSAATGSWSILHLGDRPDVQQELYDEQVKHFSDGQGGFKPLAYDTLSTPKLMAVIKEVLRLHPPLHSIMRKVVSDIPVPSVLATPHNADKKLQDAGTTLIIPKGHYVLAAPGVSMLDPDFWGSDVKVFDHNRWLDERMKSDEDEGEEDYGWGKIKRGGASAYLPFGAGRHRCIGEHFANLQLGTIIATLVRETTWTADQGVPDHDYTTMIVTPKKPRNVTFKKRSV